MTLRVSAPLLAGTLALVSCGGSSNTTPPAPPNISGDYTGSVQDSVNGTLTATATLSQHGGSAGGILTTTAGTAVQNSAVTLVISSSNALSGTIVQDLPSGVTCTFSTTGSYNTGSQQITGSYTAVTGCAGQNGTYTLDQTCTDTVTSRIGPHRLGVPKC